MKLIGNQELKISIQQINTKITYPTENKDPSGFQLVKNYVFNRHSSAVRIPVNSLALGVAGAFFGLGKSIYLSLPRRATTISHGMGALGMGLLYFSIDLLFDIFQGYSATNEIANGIVRRSIDREQLFYSNTAAAIVTNIATFGYLNSSNKAPLKSTFLRSFKYTWTLCVAAMFWDIFLVQMRHYFLVNGLNSSRKELFKINQIPSDGKKWLHMKRIDKLREESSMERYGTPQLTETIYSTRDPSITFEDVKEKIQKHKEQLEAQNLISTATPTSIFSKTQPQQQQQQQQSQPK